MGRTAAALAVVVVRKGDIVAAGQAVQNSVRDLHFDIRQRYRYYLIMLETGFSTLTSVFARKSSFALNLSVPQHLLQDICMYAQARDETDVFMHIRHLICSVYLSYDFSKVFTASTA